MLDKKYRKYKAPNIFQRNFSFAGHIERKEFFSEIGIRLIGFLCASIFLCIVLSVTIPGSTEQIIAAVDVAIPVLAVVWAIPMIALTRRRLRDAGYDGKSYLWLLLPVIGWIIFLLRLCKK